jgi:hypothetical protein
MRATEKTVMNQLVFAAVRSGQRVLMSEKHAATFSGYADDTVAACVTDYKEACRVGALVLERPFYGNNRHGYQVCQLTVGGGQRHITRMFPTAQEAANALEAAYQFLMLDKGAR